MNNNTNSNGVTRKLVSIVKTKVLVENTDDMMIYVKDENNQMFWLTSSNFLLNYRTN